MQAVEVAGQILLTGMYRCDEGLHRVDLRDAATGEVIDVISGYKQRWDYPAEYFTSFSLLGETHILYRRPRPNGYCVRRVTPRGFEYIEESASTYGSGCLALAPAVLSGRLAILTCDERSAQFREWANGDHVLRTWTAPDGWTEPRPVSIGGRPYLWLAYDGPRCTTRLWDPTSDTPVGPPLLANWPRWGPWSLDRRPVVLFKAGRRDFQVWDLARQEPCGPGLGDLELENPSVGVVHGRPALVATVGTSLRIWDIRTGRLVSATDLPDTPIATAIDPKATAWAITSTGYIGSLTVTPAEIHPAAARRNNKRQAAGRREGTSHREDSGLQTDSPSTS